MGREIKIKRLWKKRLVSLCLLFALCCIVPEPYYGTEASEAEGGAQGYSMDRPLLMRGKSLEKAASFANVRSFAELKEALGKTGSEIYINDQITITENLEIPAGKLLLRGYNCCYGTMFVVPSGVTVTVRAEIDASGDQTQLYSGPVFDVQSGGSLKILSGSIYGSVSGNDGGAIVNNGTVEMKGGILQGHTTTKRGGAIYNNGKLTITGGQLIDNRAMADANVNAGGAIYNTAAGILELTGGISRTNYSLGNGGAIFNEGSLSIERGRIQENKAQKKGRGIYSTKNVSYVGDSYVNSDEVVSEKDILVQGKRFSNASVMTCVSFQNTNGATNQSSGKITCTGISGEVVNQGNIYYNGDGTFNGKVTGGGWFHTSKVLTIDAPEFTSGIAVDKGELTITDADMAECEIMVSSGILKSSGSGTVKVKSISIKGGMYLIQNAPYSTEKSSLENCLYLDTKSIRYGYGGRLVVKSKDNPILEGKKVYYVPIGKNVSIGQGEIDIAQIKNSSDSTISEKGKFKRSLQQEPDVTYIQIQPIEFYDLKVLFVDEDGKRQMFTQDEVDISIRTSKDYLGFMERIPDSEGFNTPENENYGGYIFSGVPDGNLSVSAKFTNKIYRSLFGSIDLQKNDKIVLRVQKLNIESKGHWWTNEGNYDLNKYNELKNAASNTKIQIGNARELAAVAKIVSWPESGEVTRDLSGITLELSNDIDLKEYQWKPIGYEGKVFNGVFDGKKHTIRNMSIGCPEEDSSLQYCGLFGYCGNNGIISDVVLNDYTIRMKIELPNYNIGGMVGSLSGKIENCVAAKGKMEMALSTNTNLGGMIGSISTTGSADKCSVKDIDMDIQRITNISESKNLIGGFVGESRGNIKASSAVGGSIVSRECVGGFGGCSYGSVKNCYSDMEMTGKGLYGDMAGFIYEIKSGTVENCYSQGNLNGGSTGGFAYGIQANVLNCYSKCNITGDLIAGFTVFFPRGKISNCYVDGNLQMGSGSSVAGAAGFLLTGGDGSSSVKNSFFTGKLINSSGVITASHAGFADTNGSDIEMVDNYALAKTTRGSRDEAGGFGGSFFERNRTHNNFYYSDIGCATYNSVFYGITRILEPKYTFSEGRTKAVTYTLHKNDLPGGATVKSFRFDDDIPGASIQKINDTTYEVTPLINFGTIHLSGEMTVSHSKLQEVTGDVPEGWDFKCSPEDTTMPVTEDILLLGLDFENEEILTPNIIGLEKNGKAGTVDADNNQILRFPVSLGDFGNLVSFMSPIHQSSIFIPERPKVPVVSCMVSADKKVLMFATNKRHTLYRTEENDIRPNTRYEYSLDGGKNYQRITSTSDGKVVLQLTAGLLSNWTGIGNAGDIKDARLRLAATDSSFRSKALAEEAGSEVEPPKPSDDVFQVTYYLNDGTNNLYKADMAVDGKVSEPKAPERSGFVFKGWFKERVPQQNAVPYDFSQILTESIKLYAKWESVTYTIRTESNAPSKSKQIVYGAAGDRADAAPEGVFREGDTVVLEAEATDSMYKFSCWKDNDTVVSEEPVFEMKVTKNQTLTANFINEKPKAPTPGVPEYHWLTHKEIGITVVSGQEYAIRKEGEGSYSNWQTSGEFKGLDSATTYYIITRLPESDTLAESDPSQPLRFSTLKPVDTDAPVLKRISPEEKTIQVETRLGEEYAIRRKGTQAYSQWQVSGLFQGLQPDAVYEVVSRMAERPGIQPAGPASAPLEVYLPKPAEPTPTPTPTPAPEPSPVPTPSPTPEPGPTPIPDTEPNTEQISGYVVTFMDGAAVVSTQTIPKGGAAVAPDISKKGYQLSWSIPYANVTNNLIVRAVWKPNVYTISFKGNGGKVSGNDKKTVVYDRKYDVLPKASRKGYQFKGWYSKKSKGVRMKEDTVVKILKNTTYYAQWSKISLKKPNLKQLKNTKGLKISAVWTKVSGAEGYQLEYSTSSKFTKSTTKTIKVSKPKNGDPSKTISKLKKGKTYYVRISAYIKDSTGKTLYSAKSNVKKLAVKK